ncbi:hypothetical protein MKW94_019173 [Papaver nudicaule]|uniref:Ribokinase n=1 Tax=Papaver nudicaule TaxID=74823 RepID=A0AA42AX28_PAPNU|nr:hypothetical protein [Papaver nudicaule]
MRGITYSTSQNWITNNNNITQQHQSTKKALNTNTNYLNTTKSSKTKQCPSFSIHSSKTLTPKTDNNQNPPLVVVGSANADIYVEIDRLPKEGETISAKTGQTLAGGKGANQAVCSGQVGEDAHGNLITNALKECGVVIDHLNTVSSVPTGHAVVMLQADGQNSIIIVGGANMSCWPNTLSDQDLDVIKKAGIVLLQREIPDSVNIQVAKAARSAGVPVILDTGGMEGPIPVELLTHVDILSPNETELARLTGMPTESFEQISQAVAKCHELGAKQVLVKLGTKGSALFVEGEEPIKQPMISAEKVLDTTGAGDTFTAAFSVALVEGKSVRECLRFAAAAASLCVQVKGAIPSMPDREAVFSLLQSL